MAEDSITSELPVLPKIHRVGDKVEAKCAGWTKYYGGEIVRKNSDGTYDIKFEDGERKRGVKENQIRGKSEGDSLPPKPVKQDSEGLRSVGDGKSEILPESSVEERISKVAERPIAGAENNLEESSSVFEISDNSMVRLSNAAATTINSVARGHLDRSKVSSMQKNLVEEHAATEIAARCRGYLVRKNHAQNKKMPVLQEEGKSLVETEEEKESVQDEYSGYLMGQGWIQYSTEHGDVYYYNKITHVSQWHCP